MYRLKQPLWNYGLAIATVLVALVLMLLLDSYIELTKASFLLFFLAITFSALYGGKRAGIVATLLSALCAIYFFLEPAFSLNLNFATGISVGIFIFQGCLISILVGGLRRAQQRTRKTLKEREQATAELCQSEERLRLAMEGAQMGTWDVDLSTGEALWSKLHFTVLGYEPTPTGKATEAMWSSRIHPDDQEQVRQEWQQSRQEHRLYRTEYRIIRVDNQQIVWLAALGSFTYNQNGEAIRSIGVLFDITARKQAEVDLQQRETELRLVTNTVPALISFVDADQCYRFNNRGYEDWFGHSAATVYGRPLWEVLGKSAYATIQPYVERVLLGEEVTYESQVPYRDGGTRYIHATYVPWFGDQGQVEGFVALVSDISARRRAEIALQHSEERFRAIVKQVMTGIAQTDLMGHFTLVNQRYCDIVGYAETELLQMRMQEITHPDDLPHNLELFQRLVAEGEEFTIEKRYLRKDGSEVWVSNSVSIVRDEDGNPQSAVAVVLDMSDRKRRELNADFLADTSKDLTRATSMQDIFQAVGEKTCYHFGFSLLTFSEVHPSATVAQIIYHSSDPELNDPRGEHRLAAYLTPTQIEQLQAGQVVAIDDVGTLELEGGIAAYQPFQVRSVLVAPYISDGRLKFIVAGSRRTSSQWRSNEVELLQELTARIWIRIERARAETALRDSEEQYRIAVEAADLATWDWNLVSNEVRWNERHFLLLGLEPCHNPLTPDVFFNRVHPNDQQLVQKQLEQAIAEQGAFDMKFRVLLADGSIRWMNGYGRVVEIVDGQAARISGVLFDVTERERLLQQEQAARKEAETANRIKDEFLAVLSHELRSPLNPILGWTKLLQSQTFSPQEVSQALGTIERNAKLQAQLIEDLLDVSRILRGKMALNVCPVNLVSTIEAAIETVRLAAEAREIQIQTHLDTSVGRVSGDAARLQQIVWNLLTNAVKFTPQGGRVSVRLTQVDSYAQIQVQDTGKGIKPDFLPYVFDYFRQEDGATTRKFGGLGLGLAIVRYLTEQHGGTITVESAGEGQGSTFTVCFPLQSTTVEITSEPVPPQNLDLSQRKILVVDDEADMRELMQVMLDAYGAQVQVVASAIEVLNQLEYWQPDVLISDIGMPDMDGYMLLRQVRCLTPEQGGQIPAIALTAYAGEYDQQQAIAAGFQQHVAKPVEPEQLVAAILQLLQG